MSTHALDEWTRALRCLESATVLLRSGDQDGCASRAYYAAFHGVTAYFLLDGREFGKHSAVEAAVHRELVHSGHVPAEFGAAFTRLSRLRMAGDYGLKDRVRLEDAEESILRARNLLEELRRIASGRLP